MIKIGKRLVERRKYIRLAAPVSMSYIVPASGKAYDTLTKNISADGVRFETGDKTLKVSDMIELKLNITNSPNPVHVKGKIIWKEKLSLEDRAPFDVGIEFVEIEEDNKNTFLRFLCDAIYNMPKETKHADKKG